MIVDKIALRDATTYGFNNYVNWKRKEKEVKIKVNAYLEKLRELYLHDEPVLEVISELQLKVDELCFMKNKNTKDIINEFLLPLALYIDVENTRLCGICQEMDMLKSTWESNVAHGIRLLEMMEADKAKLDRARCTPALLFMMLHYCSKYKIFFFDIPKKNDSLAVFSQIIFPRSKVYIRFKEVFKNYETYAAEFDEFLLNEFPEYVVK